MKQALGGSICSIITDDETWVIDIGKTSVLQMFYIGLVPFTSDADFSYL